MVIAASNWLRQSQLSWLITANNWPRILIHRQFFDRQIERVLQKPYLINMSKYKVAHKYFINLFWETLII